MTQRKKKSRGLIRVMILKPEMRLPLLSFLFLFILQFSFLLHYNPVQCSCGSLQAHQHIVADILQLSLDLLTVLAGHLLFLLVALGFLFNAGDDSPGGAAGSHHVLVGDGQQVPLLVGELVPLFSHCLHGSSHVIIALCLLGQLSFLYQITLIHLRTERNRETNLLQTLYLGYGCCC